ncbi:SWIM zinc finger family protein [Streptomyces sp. NPDC050698]
MLRSAGASGSAGVSRSAGASEDGSQPGAVNAPGAAAVPRSAVAPESAAAPRTVSAPDDTPADAPSQPETSGDPQPAAPAGPTPAGAAPVRSEDRPGTGQRPADVAREALRAARDDARRAREETEREGARRRRRARQSAVDERTAAVRRASADAPGGGARDVRQLLSDAFRMPSPPDTTQDDGEQTSGQDEGRSPRMTGLLHGPDAPGAHTPDSAPGTENAELPPEPHSAPAGSSRPAPRAPEPGPHPGDPAAPDLDPDPAHAPFPAAAARSHRPPRSPRSMAAPTRDSELRRTFPPFPPRDGDRFAESWWGNAWVSALEQGALDVKRLERGRGYAGQGHVDAITVTPGLVLAYVQGSRPRPYRVQVRLRTLDDTDWDRFLDAAADRPGHIAALLDKEMPQSLADCGVPLLPGAGDLEPRCSCPDRGHPCKHAAALCYQTARLLDADPFVLLLLRGRGERELLDALSRLSATRAARAAQDRGPAPLPGVRAADVLASRAHPPLPAPLPAPAHPEQPPAYPAAPGGPDPFALDQLATDAAARAHALLSTGRDPVGQLTFWQDAVRLAAARPGAGLTAGTRALYASLAEAAGRTPSELARAVAAWRQGGLEGLAVLEEPWDPPAGRFDRARPLLLAADLPAFRPWRNHLTHPRGHVQLRLGRDGLWYAYESEPGHDDWWPRGTPDLDPVGALTGLGLPSDL